MAKSAWYFKAISFIAQEAHRWYGRRQLQPEAKLTRGDSSSADAGLRHRAGLKPTDNLRTRAARITRIICGGKAFGHLRRRRSNRFAPEKGITRQEMFTLLYNALRTIGQLPQGDCGKTLSDFDDAGLIDSGQKIHEDACQNRNRRRQRRKAVAGNYDDQSGIAQIFIICWGNSELLESQTKAESQSQNRNCLSVFLVARTPGTPWFSKCPYGRQPFFYCCSYTGIATAFDKQQKLILA